jgi:hypothetical protein
MREKKNRTTFTAAGAAFILACALLPISLTATPDAAAQTQDAQTDVSAKHKQAIADFEQRVKDYVKLREGLEDKMPKLPADSKPEQIEAHKAAFQDTVRTARTGAKHGDIFTPDIAEFIRLTIQNEFKGEDRQELRKSVFEAETDGITVRVNYPYPESKELVEMPPTLLLKLPQLPKQIRYRFVGTHMLLVDRENGLIIDYMPHALP